MTDRHAGYLVTLGKDIRDDDAQAIITALKQVRGVIGVQPIISDVSVGLAQTRAEFAMRERVLAALYPEEK